MEDYEKKYKNALAIAKDCLKDSTITSTAIDYISTIFPELTENKDERIRNRILLSLEKDLMATKNSGCDTQDLEQCIAWLEKQGKPSDQIHYWTEEEIEPIISDYLRGAEHYGGMIGRLKCLKPKSLEKQGEQKPILDFKASNWYVSKVDGKIHDMTYNPADKVEPFDKYEGLTDFERTLADICIGWIGEELGWKQYIKDNADVLLKIAIKMFNSIQDAPFEQKPAWSDEDEEKLQDCIGAIWAADYYLYEDKQEMEVWLKSIKDRIGG